ncbi:ABC transporter substrate-binding protein [Micromonospora sp. NPDC005163]
MRKPKWFALLAVATVVATTACGSGGDERSEGDQTVKIDVGGLPLAALAPLYLGIDKGFFADEGLEVTPQQAQGGAALLPAVVSGDMEFAYSNTASLITASVKGLPVQIVANGNDETNDIKKASSTVVSKGGGPIRQPADLAGKTIAVNTLNNVGDITIKAALEKSGVDISGLKFVELPFPDMLPALEAGRVDAVWLVTPFTQTAKDAGHQEVLRPFFDTQPGLNIATYFTSQRYAKEHPDVVAGFVRAMNKSLTYTNDHPDELRAAVKTYAKIPDDVLGKMPLPEFPAEIDVPDIELTAELMRKYGIIDKLPDFKRLVRQGA